MKNSKKSRTGKTGISRVPNMEYGNLRKPKFLCGIVLQVNNIDYYVPVTSYTQQKPDNFLIRADNGQVASYPLSSEKETAKASMKEPLDTAQAKADGYSQQSTDQHHHPDKSISER